MNLVNGIILISFVILFSWILIEARRQAKKIEEKSKGGKKK